VGDDREDAGPFRAMAVVVGLTVAALLLRNLVALVVVVPLLLLGGGVSPLLLVGVSVLGVQVVGFVGVSLLYARRTGWRAFLVRRLTGRDALWVAGGVVAALAVATGAGVVMTEFGLEPTSGIADLGELDARAFLVFIPLTARLAPTLAIALVSLLSRLRVRAYGKPARPGRDARRVQRRPARRDVPVGRGRLSRRRV
jgi:hypothetical protein